MCVQPVAWPEPDPQIAAAIAAKYRGKRPRPLAVLIRDRLGEWRAGRGGGGVGRAGGKPRPASTPVVPAKPFGGPAGVGALTRRGVAGEGGGAAREARAAAPRAWREQRVCGVDFACRYGT